MSRSDYGQGYTLFAFDLTSDHCPGDHFDLDRVELHFVQPLANTVNLIIYAEFQNVIEIDANRNDLCAIYTFGVIHFRQESNSVHEAQVVIKHLKSFLRVALRFSFRAVYFSRRERSEISLLTGTVSLRTFKIYSQIVLTKASSATFKMVLH